MNKKIFLNENEIPHSWYNIVADMQNKPLPPLHPGTKQPLSPADLEPIFAKELIKQEVSEERWIEIPDEVRELYKLWRPTPLVRATALEKALDTPAHIYFKNESVSPVGSHKLNSALPQAYYNKMQGITHLTTETGAGQWGAALSFATSLFGLKLDVFMVKVSYNQKPYRRSMMQTWGANVVASPSNLTESGRSILAKEPDNSGSLGIAISEAVEKAVQDENTRYTLGSVLNHVILHQTVIGLESEKQMDLAGEYPDIVIGCFGGGSNFSGISFPFLRHQLVDGKKIRVIAAEPASCPKLTRGVFQYDFGDTVGLTPLLPMYTLGHDFHPADIHAGGLRYHGAGTIVSQLLRDNLIEVQDIPQLETFEAGKLFANTEGIIPAPESTHAIAVAIREALKAKEEGTKKTILFNLSGHGLIDMMAYDQFFSGTMQNYKLTDEEIAKSTSVLEKIV
ncbi:MAG: TrpB-like pyridoxal-phosphate dependent enzyme [Bacteroidales bacterium 45-6]|nr:MAG: TrpB-like pyridoxal-phosphate dependent enzyme [Bacteroidales bacterium 45-6]